jgi:hypothetical protein
MLPQPPHPCSSQLPWISTLNSTPADPYTPSTKPSVDSRTCLSQSHPVRLVAKTIPGVRARTANEASPIAGRLTGARLSSPPVWTSWFPTLARWARYGSIPCCVLGTNRYSEGYSSSGASLVYQ